MISHYRLSKLTPLAKGCARQCFIAEAQPDVCVKLPLHGLGLRHCLTEEKWYKRLYAEKKHGEDLPLARYRGRVSIEGQTAFAFDLVRDASGQVSQTLFDALTLQSLEQAQQSWIDAYQQFRTAMLAGSVIASDLTGMNICVRRLADGQQRWVLVDGLGDYQRQRLTNLLPWTRRPRVKRRLDRWLYDDIRTLADAIENSRRQHKATRRTGQPIDNSVSRRAHLPGV